MKIHVTCGIFHWNTTGEQSITILFHAIENTVVNTITATYARRTMERLSVIRGLYTQPRSRFSHTDRLSLVNRMFIIWQKQEQFNLFNATGLF